MGVVFRTSRTGTTTPLEPLEKFTDIPSKSAESQLLTLFLTGRRETTLRAYRQDLEDFRRFLNVTSMGIAINQLLSAGRGGANALTLSYRTDLMNRGLQPATINRRLAALRSLIKLARMTGVADFTLEIPGVSHESYRDTRGPGRENVQKMIASVEGDSVPLRRDRAILRLLYDLGLRRGELTSLNLEDVDIVSGELWVRGKGRGNREKLSLPQPTRDALSAWIKIRGGDQGPLFLSFDRSGKGDAGGRLTPASVYRIVRATGESIGIKTRPHGLRHTAITEACKAAQKAGIGLEEVLDFSRHRNVQTLMVYRDRERNVQGQLASLIAQESPTDVVKKRL